MMSAVTKWTRFIEINLQLLGIFYPKAITTKARCDHCLLWEGREDDDDDDYDDNTVEAEGDRWSSMSWDEDEYEDSFRGRSLTNHRDVVCEGILEENRGSNVFELKSRPNRLSRGYSRVGYRPRYREPSRTSNEGRASGRRVPHRRQTSSTSVKTECGVCKSLSWDGDARPIQTTNESADGPKHRYLWAIISFVVMATLTVCSFVIAVNYIVLYFGNKYEVMHLSSFFSFLGIVNSVSIICIYAHLVYFWRGCRYSGQMDEGWPTILHQDYVMRRLLYLSMESTRSTRGRSSNGTLFIIIVALWNTVNVALKFVFMVYVKHYDFWIFETVVLAVGVYVLGVFCTFLRLMRKSFEKELELVLVFIVNHKKRLDWCRARLSETYRDYRIFNRAVHHWMLFTINLATLGLTVHLSWNYQALSSALTYQDTRKAIILNLLISSEKTLVFVLPLAALHGTDIAYLWPHFRRALSSMRRTEDELFWDDVIRHLDGLRCYGDYFGGARNNLKTLLTLACMYYGLKIGAQNWNYHDFADTSTTSAPTMSSSVYN